MHSLEALLLLLFWLLGLFKGLELLEINRGDSSPDFLVEVEIRMINYDLGRVLYRLIVTSISG